MNWRAVLRGVAMVANGLFALWLFATAAVWANDYPGGAVVAIPPVLAIVALAMSDTRGRNT